MSTDFPKISTLGERGILIQFEPEISRKVFEKVLFYKNRIENYYIKEKLEVINTYNSLLISYLYSIEDTYSAFSDLKVLLEEPFSPSSSNTKLYFLPVCYEAEFAPDLKVISSQNNLEIDEIIRLHTSVFYDLFFIGFLPGFLYLGGLDKKLIISRKKIPRKSVPKGAVGIGENQTGIYPKSSPGGWQIIGRCPIELFDKNKEPPGPFEIGSKIKFFEVSKQEFKEISEQVKAGTYNIKTEIYET